MQTFQFGALPKKRFEVLDDGTITIKQKLSKDYVFSADRIVTVFLAPATFGQAGEVFLSLNGQPSADPLLRLTGFLYYKKQQDQLDAFIALLQTLNNAIDVKTHHKTASVSSKPAKSNKKAMHCPKCRSTNVTFMDNQRKSFSVGKAVAGTALTGGIGSLAGFAGKKGKDRWHCQKCGHVFEK